MAKHFFNNKDINIRTKYNVYTSFVLNAALWGCESWNLSARNKNQLESFHHSAIRRILNIQWSQVREERIRNKQVRFRFCNIPKIETFINKRTATYIGKIARSDNEELPKKFLGAWMHKPRKPGGQQLSCNNNFARAITAVIPDTQLENQGLLFKKWILIAINEESGWSISRLTLKRARQLTRKEMKTLMKRDLRHPKNMRTQKQLRRASTYTTSIPAPTPVENKQQVVLVPPPPAPQMHT
jgi:hypothetical protein